jgi:hypothetical protein
MHLAITIQQENLIFSRARFLSMNSLCMIDNMKSFLLEILQFLEKCYKNGP